MEPEKGSLRRGEVWSLREGRYGAWEMEPEKGSLRRGGGGGMEPEKRGYEA